jgi:hypothetical protein
MTSSGTTTFQLNLSDVMEEAYEQAGRRMQGGYDYRTARRSLDLLMQEWCNRGFNLWLVDQQDIAMLANVNSYTLPADTIDVTDAVYRRNAGTLETQSDIFLNRISVSDYAAIPTKLTTGPQPYNYYIDRQRDAPVMFVWPVPNDIQAGVIHYWRLRRIQDSGTPGSNTMDVPFRFVPAMVAGLAFNIAKKYPDLMGRLEMLKGAYEEQFLLAAGEDRDRASVRLTPYIDYNL